MSNQKYDEYKRQHPEWNDEQIWTAISLSMEAENVIDNAGKNVSADDPEIWEKIVVGARNWLSVTLPGIFARVGSFFDNLLSTIGQWVGKGLRYIFDAIAGLFGVE